MKRLRIINNECELYDGDKLVLSHKKGDLARGVYQALNARNLRTIDKNENIRAGYYQAKDAERGKKKILRMPDQEYLYKVRQTPLMRILQTIFQPTAEELQWIYTDFQLSIEWGTPWKKTV